MAKSIKFVLPGDENNDVEVKPSFDKFGDAMAVRFSADGYSPRVVHLTARGTLYRPAMNDEAARALGIQLDDDGRIKLEE